MDEKKKNWQIKWAEMIVNMQDYNNPQLSRFIKGGGAQSQSNQHLSPTLTTQ